MASHHPASSLSHAHSHTDHHRHEAGMPPPDHIPGRAADPNANGDAGGVLRRNQACLNCRRRKLKCDAVRPHCGTCVRSFKHLQRTVPHGNHVLACEYEDSVSATGPEYRVSPASESAEDESAKKRKRKSTGEPKKSSKSEDEENFRLRRKIGGSGVCHLPSSVLRLTTELLEAKLASQPEPQPQQQWSAPMAGSVSAPSPTAFLEMLSSAATAHASETSSASVPGLRDGAANAMMGSTWATTPKDSSMASTGLTPFLSFSDNQAAQSEGEKRQDNGISPATHDSRRSSVFGASQSSFGTTSNSPANATVPSPNNFLNFSPAPAPSGSNTSSTENINWPPPPGPDGTLHPSHRTEGPWRGVETVYTIDQHQQKAENVADMDRVGDESEAIQQELLLDIFWPGWPRTLPEPNIVNDLVESFFELEPYLPRLLHRPRFFARLALPPTHTNFPHPSLIHAICAAASSWCSPSVYERSNRAQWSDEKGSNFTMRQTAYAKEAVQDGLNTGNRLFDVVRAMIVLSRVFIDETRMLECWAYGGLVARMMLPLGINVRSAELSLKSVMLPPPTDALEREERRVAVWMAFYHDTVASAASGWGTSMSIDELSIPLPASSADFELGLDEIESNPQDLESVDLWTKHPVPDAFVMVVKSVVLLNRVNRFVRKWKNRHLRPDDDFDGLSRPEFRELANAIACFQMSFPPNLRNIVKPTAKRRLDINVVTAHLIPQAAIICLYEPFADITDLNDTATRRLMGASQTVVSIVQQLANVNINDASNLVHVMHSGVSVSLITAARTSLLFYRHFLNINDQAAAETHRMDIEMIRTSLHAFGLRSKIGHHHAQLLEYFVDRARAPSYEKLQAHYPTHPRDGAPELHPNADFGLCVTNALNIKRGFWRRWSDLSANIGVSPFGSTPDTAAYASSAAAQGPPTGGSHSSGTGTDASARISTLPADSPSSYAGAEQKEAAKAKASLYGNMSFGVCPVPGAFKGAEEMAQAHNIINDRPVSSASISESVSAAAPSRRSTGSHTRVEEITSYTGPNSTFAPAPSSAEKAAQAAQSARAAQEELSNFSAAYAQYLLDPLHAEVADPMDGVNARAMRQFDSIGTLKDGQMSLFMFDSGDSPTNGHMGNGIGNGSGGGLSKEMEALFDGAGVVKDGQRTVYSNMRPGGAMN